MFDVDAVPATLAGARTRSAQLEAALARDPGAHRVLTGDRPTGPLHLGHFFGTLENRVRLQDLGVDLLVLVADYQTIIDRDSPASLPRDVEALVAEYLAIGIDPARATIFAHSQVEALNQLLLPFLSLVSVAELARNPTVKDEMAAAGLTAMPGSMFTYPVHQAADILFCRATAVPVGKDQLPHLELARVGRPPVQPALQRRGAVLPRARGAADRRPGAARHRRAEDEQEPRQRDRDRRDGRRDRPARRRRQDGRRAPHRVRPGPPARRVEPRAARRAVPRAHARGVAAEVGDAGSAALKRLVTEAINERFRTIRARRIELLADRGHLRDVLARGTSGRARSRRRRSPTSGA